MQRPKKSLKPLIHNDIEKSLSVNPGAAEGRLPCANKQQVPGLRRHEQGKIACRTAYQPCRGDVSMKPLPTTVTLLALLAAAGIAHAADQDLGRNLAATCATCHGTNGKAVQGAGMEALAGMDKAKALQKLSEFRSGAKPASIMHQISKGFTDEQLDLMAAFFAAQK
jgi:cytochrome subunit of sulfide dehydrogenase